MCKTFISEVIQMSTNMTASDSFELAGDILDALRGRLRTTGKLTVQTFGTFVVKDVPERIRLNPKTGQPVNVKAGKTVRFKVSPSLRRII